MLKFLGLLAGPWPLLSNVRWPERSVLADSRGILAGVALPVSFYSNKYGREVFLRQNTATHNAVVIMDRRGGSTMKRILKEDFRADNSLWTDFNLSLEKGDADESDE